MSLLVLKLLLIGLCFYTSVKALWYVVGRLFRDWIRDWCLMLCRFMFWVEVFCEVGACLLCDFAVVESGLLVMLVFYVLRGVAFD